MHGPHSPRSLQPHEIFTPATRILSVSSLKGPAAAVFASLMGPLAFQGHGTTPRRWGDPDYSGSWDQALSRLMGPPVSPAA